MDMVYSIINIYDKLKFKYSEYLKPEIISVVIMQSEEEVLLESVELEITEDGLEKHTVRRINLDFIAEGEECEKAFFDPKASIEVNARKFINDFTPYSIINTTDLFCDKACNKISIKYNTFGIDR